MKDRHREKFSKLKNELAEWRDSTLANVVSTKVSAGKHAPYADTFEQFARGMLATGTSASSCVDKVLRCANFFWKARQGKPL